MNGHETGKIIRVDDSEHITEGSLDSEDLTGDSAGRAENHEGLSCVENSLAGHVARDSERGFERAVEDTYTVDELLETLVSENSNYQLTNHDVHKLIDAGHGRAVARNLDRFTGLDASIAYELIDAGCGGIVGRYLKNFTGLDASIAHKLIDAGYELQVLQCVYVFGEAAPEIVLSCIDKIKLSDDLADAVLGHLSYYGMDTVARSTVLWACANHYSTAQKVTQLDLEGLIGAEEASRLRAYIAELKPELRGVVKYHSYADEAGDIEHVTSSRPGTEFHKRAVQADRRLRLPKTEDDRRLRETIKQAYDKLQKDIDSVAVRRPVCPRVIRWARRQDR